MWVAFLRNNYVFPKVDIVFLVFILNNYEHCPCFTTKHEYVMADIYTTKHEYVMADIYTTKHE